ncbi:centriolar and ciliogenesis-associated protein HYSL1 isoform X1 [Myxocyprinus asiaticus]|uniref:centriolar and ciliogenesis-associated protein HYSL1 isoform X1 n=1 Tax=Myxocyprinus asiaticus TaxID=70543 RepID=UPI002221FB3B|nr:centriolar and ciliogenesis-associated protein HYSL1 isoform X1 [Myxocyprinus asiaticus]
MDYLDFSEEEIQQQLAALGYSSIPKQRLQEFKRDLDQLIRHEKSKSHNSSEWTSPTSHSSSSKSPPALFKEKVQLGTNHNYVFSDTSSAGQQREIFTSTFNEDDYRESGMNNYYDSYLRHSVAHRPARPSTAPNRLETEERPSEIFHSVLDTSETTSPDRDNRAHSKPVIKRKVLRKHQGQSHVCDESTHSEDSGAVSELEEQLDQMRIGAQHVQYDSECEETGSYSDRSSSATEDLPRAFREYMKGMKRSHSESDIRTRPKSFIRPVFDHPHTRNLKKTDPVAKYFQYKQDWEMFKPPGEKSRKELHWAIREQLLYQPPPQRPQKKYIPNNYVVPTEKKRSALRWEIRHDLAHGIIPPKISYP